MDAEAIMSVAVAVEGNTVKYVQKYCAAGGFFRTVIETFISAVVKKPFTLKEMQYRGT